MTVISFSFSYFIDFLLNKYIYNEYLFVKFLSNDFVRTYRSIYVYCYIWKYVRYNQTKKLQ